MDIERTSAEVEYGIDNLDKAYLSVFLQFMHTAFMSMNFQRRLRILYEGSRDASRRFQYLLLGLDLGILVFLILSSFFYGHRIIGFLECLFGLYILSDFLARLYISRDRAKFLANPYSIADILVITSFFLPFAGQQLAFLRALSILRLVRSMHFLERLRRDFRAFRKYEDIHISAINFLVFIFVITELVFQTQVGARQGINDFIDAMYFTVTTLTTTGFGDIVLQGTMGRLLTIIIMIFGVSLFLHLIQTILRPFKMRHSCKCGLNLHDCDAAHCKVCGRTLDTEA